MLYFHRRIVVGIRGEGGVFECMTTVVIPALQPKQYSRVLVSMQGYTVTTAETYWCSSALLLLHQTCEHALKLLYHLILRGLKCSGFLKSPSLH